MRWLATFVAALGLAVPAPALAWALETHLYIARMVLEDVRDDGRISLCVGGRGPSGVDCARQYPVPAAVRDALVTHPEAYLAGVLGPDVYPDFVTGQVTVHPGVPGEHGWVTRDWLDYLLRRAGGSSELAFAYGFTGHASGDVFAHTYVNAYAGDIFDLKAHLRHRNEVEIRHYLLERFIAQRTPASWAGGPSDAPFGAPHDFVVEQLLFAPQVGGQYRSQGVTAVPTLIYVRYQEALARLRLAEAEGPISESRQARARLELDTYRLAAVSFSKASEAVAHALVSPRLEDRVLGDRSRLHPYADWVRCWGPVLTIGASKVTAASCRLVTGYANLVQRYKETIDYEWSESSPQSYKAALRGVRALEDVQGAVLEAVVGSAHRDAARLLRVQRKGGGVSAAVLDKVFAKDDGGQRLLQPGGVSAMVLTDMGMTPADTAFAPEGFAAIYNSIVLSKLALLDGAALNQLLADHGVARLYDEAAPGPTSILTEGVRSIDGNHQWQRQPLPYPRRSGQDEGWSSRAFGSPGAPGEVSAFRLWGNPEARARVFRVVFKGPLNPGLEAYLATTPGLPAYAFPACALNPFPSTTAPDGAAQAQDTACRP